MIARQDSKAKAGGTVEEDPRRIADDGKSIRPGFRDLPWSCRWGVASVETQATEINHDESAKVCVQSAEDREYQGGSRTNNNTKISNHENTCVFIVRHVAVSYHGRVSAFAITVIDMLACKTTHLLLQARPCQSVSASLKSCTGKTMLASESVRSLRCNEVSLLSWKRVVSFEANSRKIGHFRLKFQSVGDLCRRQFHRSDCNMGRGLEGESCQ